MRRLRVRFDGSVLSSEMAVIHAGWLSPTGEAGLRPPCPPVVMGIAFRSSNRAAGRTVHSVYRPTGPINSTHFKSAPGLVAFQKSTRSATRKPKIGSISRFGFIPHRLAAVGSLSQLGCLLSTHA